MSFVRNAALTLLSATAISYSIVSLLSVSPANAAEWLQNGSFENGLSGWDTAYATTGCPARSGNGAASISVTSDGSTIGQIVADNPSPGRYLFRGFARSLNGEAIELTANLQQVGNPTRGTASIHLTSAYAPFSVELNFDGVTGARVAVVLASEQAAVACLDDLSLEGPLNTTPVPTATETATATASPTPPPAPSATATRTPTAPPSSATPPAATATRPPATATPAPPTSTPAPGLQFVNGGFENGVYGWRTQGGQLDTVTDPALRGAAAGRYSSTTSATKFVYQVVAIDPDRAYEFRGAIRTEGAVAEAFLRIAWYASSDGSGSQMSTIDSAQGVGPDSGGFVTLSTGVVQPPAGANSARLRVVLAPSSAATAIIYLDDFAWEDSEPAPPTPTAAPSASAAASVTATQAAQASAGDGEEPRRGATVVRTATAQVTAARASATPGEAAAARAPTATPRSRTPAATANEAAVEDSNTIWPYLVALPLSAILGAAGYVYTKRRGV